MNAQQLAAYEALCQKVPEARCPDLKFSTGANCWVCRGAFLDASHALAILTAHLERMLPRGALLYWPSSDNEKWAYSIGVSEELRTRLLDDPDRFIALCRAVGESR